MSKKEQMSFEDKMKLKAKKAFKNSRYGWIGGIKGRLLIFVGTFILPMMFSLFLFAAVMVVLSGGIVAILEIDPDLKVSENPVEENEGGGDLSGRVIDIPAELQGKMFYPVGKRITSLVAKKRVLEVNGKWQSKPHIGLDIAGAFNASNAPDIYPIYPGEVFVKKSTSGGLGNFIVLKHTAGGETIYSVYGHMAKVYVNKGDVLGYNDKIGRMGKTGNSTGIHLHLEIHTDKMPASGYGNINTILDPIDVLQCTATEKLPKKSPQELGKCLDYRNSVTSGTQ